MPFSRTGAGTGSTDTRFIVFMKVLITGICSDIGLAQVNGFHNAVVAGSAPVHLPAELWSTAPQLPTSDGHDHTYDLSKNLQESIARAALRSVDVIVLFGPFGLSGLIWWPVCLKTR